MAAEGEMDVRKAASSNSSLLPRVPVTDLMGSGREAVLVHDGTEYRLRLTSNGKLILTK